jgi:hypothetical protein
VTESNEPVGTMWVERGPTPKDDRAWVKIESGEWVPTKPPPRSAEGPSDAVER